MRRKWIEAIICVIVFGCMFTHQIVASTPDIALKVATNENEITTITNFELFISGNDDFHQKANEWGWSGTGDELTPYIIDNLNYLIKIENVSLCFVIHNCTFSNGYQNGYGIFLDRVSHAVITQNFFQNNSRGIGLKKCTDVMITHNYLLNNSEGIDVEFSHAFQTIVISNNVLNVSGGIYLSYSTGIVVDENIIKNSGDVQKGIYLRDSNENNITNNVLINSTIFIDNTITTIGGEKDIRQTSVRGNSINGKPVIYFQEKDGVNFEEETVGKVIFNTCNNVTLMNQHFSNTYTQFDFVQCRNVTILNCSFTQLPEIPVQVRHTNYFQLENNIFSNCPYGVSLLDTIFGRIVKNRFENNTIGIKAIFTSNYIISDNFLSNSLDYGILLGGCNLDQISGNYFSENRYGIFLRGSTSIHIINNILMNNSGWGILGCYQSKSINITSNVISSTGLKSNGTQIGIGIYFHNVYNSMISKNNITNNRNYGVYLERSKNTRVVNNNFVNNNPNGTSQAYSRWKYKEKYSESFDDFSHNYWSDWISPDNNEDGIVDVPYSIYCEGDVNFTDSYPLVKPLNNTFFDAESIRTTTTSSGIEGGNLLSLVLIMAFISSIRKRRKT